MDTDRTDKIATEKAKEERLNQAQALKLTKMSAIEREEYDRNLAAVVDKKAHDAAAKAKKEADKAEAKTQKELEKAEAKTQKELKAAEKAIKAQEKQAAVALAAAAGQ